MLGNAHNSACNMLQEHVLFHYLQVSCGSRIVLQLLLSNCLRLKDPFSLEHLA